MPFGRGSSFWIKVDHIANPTPAFLKATKQLQPGKAPGPDGIPAEIFKAGGDALTTRLALLLQSF